MVRMCKIIAQKGDLIRIFFTHTHLDVLTLIDGVI